MLIITEGELRSTTKKLWRHLNYILDLKKFSDPIHLVTVITSKCNLRCEFCYVIDRERKHELDFIKLKHFISVIQPLSVEITGGEPTLYPYISEYIDFLHRNIIKIGMTTNGTHLHDIKEINLKKMDWIRVSINHYIEDDIEFTDTKYPEKLGYIYIKHKNSPPDLVFRLVEFMKTHRGKYLKVAVDVTDKSIKEFESVPYYNIIGQERFKTKHFKGICYMGWLKPIIEPDGRVYACVANKIKAITDIDNPKDLLNYRDIHMDCKECPFYDRNKFIDYILENYIEDEDFI